jgi:hypothetical protein
MVCNAQHYWAFGLCPPSGIIETRKTAFRKPDLFSSSGEGEEKTPVIEINLF